MKGFSKSIFHPLAIACIVSIICIFLIHPWTNKYYDSLIGWDKLGYYLYLPVTFIYKDWHSLHFISSFFNHYQPSNQWYQTTLLENGNQVMTYTLGVALLQLPFFLLGHLSALLFNFKTDGFSQPYIFWIYFSGLFYSCIGVFYSYKNLQFFFDDKISKIVLFLLFATSPLFYYCFVDNIMPHSYLFALYSILFYFTIRWHQIPSYTNTIKICVCIGLMVSIRATECIALLIPLLWTIRNRDTLEQKLFLLKKNYGKLIIGILIGAAPFFLQMVYWKFSTGHFIFNSYSTTHQGFSWLHPHLFSYFLSFRKGLFVFNPFMIFSITGFLIILKNHVFRNLRLPIILFFLVNIYILSSWDQWWYGGSFGQRSLLQSYALLLFPLCACVQWLSLKKIRKLSLWLISILCVFVNILFTWQYCHAIIEPDGTTRRIFVHYFINPFYGHITGGYIDSQGNWKSTFITSNKIFYVDNFEEEPTAISDSGSKIFPVYPYTIKEIQIIHTDSLRNHVGEWIRCSFEMKHINTDSLQLNNLIVYAEIRDNLNNIVLWKSKNFNFLFQDSKDFGVWKKCFADFEIPVSFYNVENMHFCFSMNGHEEAQLKKVSLSYLKIRK